MHLIQEFLPGGGGGVGESRLYCQKTALTTLFAFYAPKFGKVDGAYCFRLVRPSVRLSVRASVTIFFKIQF